MFFPIRAEETSKALGQIRRLRHARNLHKIGSSDIYWSAPFLAALVDVVDSLLIEKPEHSFELSAQGILLAERIRPESCPGKSELGKRSLSAWALAVHGSSCRALERYPEAEASFQRALGLARKKVYEWTAGEVWRRYAALLLMRGSLTGLEFVDQAFESYAGFPAARADALVLRGLFHLFLTKDLSTAADDTSKALEFLEAKRNAREGRTWWSALHNLGLIYAAGTSDLQSLETTLRRVRQAGRRLSRHEPIRRMFCLWIQGLLLAPLGSARMAERLLERARSWLLNNGHFHLGLSCSVDLARIAFKSGDEKKAQSGLQELPHLAEKAEPRLQAYLSKHLADVFSAGMNEGSLANFREALVAFTRDRRGQD